MSVTGETVECDASASKYSYSAIFEYLTNALYPSDVSKEYKRGDFERDLRFSVPKLDICTMLVAKLNNARGWSFKKRNFRISHQ